MRASWLVKIQEKENMKASLLLCSTLLLLGCGCCSFPAAEAKVRYYDFVLDVKNFTRLCDTKPMLVVNGEFPGPTIYVNKGDTAVVTVRNQGYYGVTLHWHGVEQPRNPWSDGPEYITQCPIEPGYNFTYEVIFSSEEGTLFWHAHSDWTRNTVHGAIVIYPEEGTTYPFPKPDEEHVIIFASWYKVDVRGVMEETLTDGGQQVHLSDGYTLNGQPGDHYNCTYDADAMYRLRVDYNKTYLLRLVNSALNQDFFYYVAGHNLTVVGWDGSYVKPVTSRYLQISPGKTMDVLVTADQTPDEYYMIANPYFDGQADDFDPQITSGVFQYNGNYTPPEHPVMPTLLSYDDIGASNSFFKRFRSLDTPEHPIDVPLNVTTKMYVTLSINLLQCPNASCSGPEGDRISASMNNRTFLNPPVDILQAYYRNMSGAYETDFPNWPEIFYDFIADDLTTDNVSYSLGGTKLKVLDYNETVEITFQSTNVLNSGEHHPIHLHGYRFYILGRGVGIFDNETDPETFNLIDPPQANTVVVPKDGWATVRFKASNPGVWFMHCHFDRHMSWGMDLVFIVKDGPTPDTSMRAPPSDLIPCNSSALAGPADSGMNARGI